MDGHADIMSGGGGATQKMINNDENGGAADVMNITVVDGQPVITEQVRGINYNNAMKAQPQEGGVGRNDGGLRSDEAVCLICCCNVCETLCDMVANLLTCFCFVKCCENNGCDCCADCTICCGECSECCGDCGCDCLS